MAVHLKLASLARSGVALLAAVALAACSDAGPALVWPGAPGSSARGGEFNVPAGQEWTFGAMIVCLDRPGVVTVRAAAIHHPTGGLRVDAFAIGPTPYAKGAPVVLGAGLGTISDLRPYVDLTASQRVTSACPSGPVSASTEAFGNELIVQVSKSSADTGSGDGVDLTYESGGETRTLTVPYGITLCAHGTLDECP